MLRTTFPVIEHHQHKYEDWSLHRMVSPIWLYFPVRHHHPIHLTDWYFEKSNQLELMLAIEKVLHFKKWNIKKQGMYPCFLLIRIYFPKFWTMYSGYASVFVLWTRQSASCFSNQLDDLDLRAFYHHSRLFFLHLIGLFFVLFILF